MSTNPANEVVIIVGHGPEEASDNVPDLKIIQAHADRIKAKKKFADVRITNIQDDAIIPVRESNVRKLRAMIQQATKAPPKVIVVPISAARYGAEYDSLSDMVSFGAAPALVIYEWSLRGMGKLGWIAAFVYCACAALRLARFNTQLEVADKRYFQGLPSQAAAQPARRRGIYLLPNLFTTAALFAGFYAIVAAIGGRYEAAAVAVFVAMVLDGVDGRVARMTKTQSDFGVELDSLADVVSFGAAPALLVYKWALAPLGFAGLFLSFAFAAAGALRLARFNVLAHRGDKASHRYFHSFAVATGQSTLKR